MSERETYLSMVRKVADQVKEIFPWDLAEAQEQGVDYLLLDVRCPHEFQRAHIRGSINVPRGVLEIAADYGYEETEPVLVEAREKRVVVICRSGNRSILAAYTLSRMGFRNVISLRTGLRGWNDYELPLWGDEERQLFLDEVDTLFEPKISPEQLGPTRQHTNINGATL